MIVKNKVFFLMGNPFIDAYIESDFLGRMIFIGLIILSICCWAILLHKSWVAYHARKQSIQFYALFQSNRTHPLGLECEAVTNNFHNPFMNLYSILKKHTVDILNKNKKFNQEREGKNNNVSYLSPTDVEFVDAHLTNGIANQIKYLEKNLFVLATIVSLGPFLGLLGTVWGILTTFSELQAQSGGSTNQMVLGGLSLALATTVLGLLDAIPALIGYNYLKNKIHVFEVEMEDFSTEILAAVEMRYRKVDLS